MDPEPAAVSNDYSDSERHSPINPSDHSFSSQSDDLLIRDGPSVAFLGFAIAIATVVVPLTAVLTVRSSRGVDKTPTVLERSDGSPASTPISVPRVSESGG